MARKNQTQIIEDNQEGDLLKTYRREGNNIVETGYLPAQRKANQVDVVSESFVADTVASALEEVQTEIEALEGNVVYKGFATGPTGTINEHWLAGFIRTPAADTTLTVGATATQVYGTANEMNGAHAFIVAGAAASAACVLTVTGVSLGDDGVRNDADSEVLFLDGTTVSTNDYIETTKKWLGQVTFTLSGTGGATIDFNYGFSKYEDFGNRDFTVTDLEFVAHTGANESDARFRMLKFSGTSNFVYHATAFDPMAGAFADSDDLLGTNIGYSTGNCFALKLTGLSIPVAGTSSEGLVMYFETASNNSLRYANLHIGAVITPTV